MNKKEKYAINGAILAGVLNGILNAIEQLREMRENPNQNFNWKRLLLATGKGAVVGGVGGLMVGAVVDYNNSTVKAVDTDKHLLKFVESIRLDKNDPAFVGLSQRAELLIGMLIKEFGSLIHDTPKLGSTRNGTALKDKFDIDFSVTFKAGSFHSTEDMFNSVLTFFERQIGFGCVTGVRTQRKSVGVFVMVDGVERRIDVVPCKLTKHANGSGYLYVNDKTLFGSPSYTKTNIRILNSVKLSPTQQKIAIVLKNWKIKHNLPISSHLLECIILDAYRTSPGIPQAFTSKVIMVLRYIADYFEVAVIRGRENTNNVLTKIPESCKSTIINAAKEALDDYIYQPNSIVDNIV